jgi:hypothetical protein
MRDVGKRRLSDDEPPPNSRLTVAEAATALGMTEAAVRGRVKRGTLRSYRESGRVYVVLEADSSRLADDAPSDQSELVTLLREQLDAERQAHAEARRIIAGLVERIPAVEAPRENVPGEPARSSEGPLSNRWANWLIPSVLGGFFQWLVPIVIVGAGATLAAISASQGQFLRAALQLGLGVVAGMASGLVATLIWRIFYSLLRRRGNS